jgi:hypothetical protein
MTAHPVRTRILATIAGFSLVGGLLSVLSPTAVDVAQAADLSTFDPGMIITDSVFTNSSSMSESDVQDFLSSKNSSCSDYTSGGVKYVCIKNYSAAYSARAANSNCAAMSADDSAKASAIIYRVAKACGLNPQVLIVLVQKEQGLLSGAKDPVRYKWATGYACPDTSACDKKYSGFFNQIWNAGWQFKQWMNPLTRQYMPGKSNAIKYHPSSSCGTASVYVKNLATAALYMYTPYVPNKAALAAGSGLGDSCSSYGNRNFFNYFSDWFGNPGNLTKNASFTSGISPWVSGSTGAISVSAESDVDRAQSGSKFALVRASAEGRRLQQTISRKSSAGQVYSGGLWLRADADSGEVSGEVLLWSTGGTLDVARVPFTVGQTWTYVPIDLAMSHSGHTGLRIAVELATAGVGLRVDTASVYYKGSNVSRTAIALEESKVGSGRNGGWLLSSSTALSLKRGKGGNVNGNYYGVLKSSTDSAYIGQLISRSVKSNTAYTYGVWVRSADGEPYSGRIRLAATGGTTETMTTNFTVGSEWTYVTVSLDVLLSKHNRLRVYIHPDQAGRTLHYDGLSLLPNLNITDASFDLDATGAISAPASTTVEQIPADESTGPAADGTGMLRVTRTTDDAGYIQLSASRKIGVGETYTAQVWVRSATPGTPHSGVLTLEARNGSGPSDSATTAYTANDSWQLVTVKLTTTLAGLTSLRTTVSLDANGDAIYVDGAQLH